MTTEYMLAPGEDQTTLARDLLSQAADPNQVHWSPRPDVHGGGVYVLADEGIAQRTRELRSARRAEEASAAPAVIAEEAPADDLDAEPDEDDADEDEGGEEAADEDAEPKPQTAAQKRAAAKKAKQAADAAEAADEEKSE